MCGVLELDPFKLQFPTEQACMEALFCARWPDGFRCPKCGCARAYVLRKRKSYQCAVCRYQCSLTAGTIFERSRTPLQKWFLAMMLVARPNGIRATALREILGVTYKTAWTMLMKIRTAISRDSDRQWLTGTVRMNTAILGTKARSTLSNLGVGERHVVAGASMGENGEAAQLKIKLVDKRHTDGGRPLPASIQAFQQAHVDPSAEDVHGVYKRFSRERYHSLLSKVKEAQQWLYKTYVAVGVKHLQKYLDEFCFRSNEQYQVQYQIHKVGGKSVKAVRDCSKSGVQTELQDRTWNPRKRDVEREGSHLVFQSLLKLCARETAVPYREIVCSQTVNPVIGTIRGSAA